MVHNRVFDIWLIADPFLTEQASTLQGTHGQEAADGLFSSINTIVINSLKAVQNVMINDRHCFELYGYDIIIDEHLKPWMIEVRGNVQLELITVDRPVRMRCSGPTWYPQAEQALQIRR